MKFDRRISRRSFLAAAGVTSAALALTACGGSSSSTAASSAASGASSAAAGTAQGGTLNIMLETEVQSLDPQVATDGTSFEVIADYTDGLMQMDADGAAVPAMAETYDISEDGKTYTFHLRDAKWSNGEAVTAADFVFGWQRAVDPATASEYSYMLSDIGQVVNAAEIIAGEKPVTDLGVTAVDDKTLEVQLNVPVSYFLSLMYFPTFYPVNEAFYNTCADTFGTSPETVLSNGAFVLTDYQPAATAFAMEKNPDYYDADKIALDGLAYQVIKDSQQALMSYQTGTLDITLLNGEQVDQVKDDPEFTSVGAGYLWYISPNIDAVPDLANLNLRKAISAALDREQIIATVYKNDNEPSPCLAYGISGVNTETFGEAVVAANGGNPLYAPTADLDSAKEYLAKALEELGYKDASEVSLCLMTSEGTQNELLSQVVQEQLRKNLGLNVTIEVLTITEWRARRNSLDFDVCFGGWGPDYNDPMTDLDLMMSTNGNNHTGYADADYDALIESTKTERDAAAREQIFVQAEMKLAEDMPVIPVYWRHEDYAASEKLVEGYARKPFQAYNFIYTKLAD